MAEAYEVARIVLRAGCALLAWAFVIRYAFVRWEQSALGRHLMSYTLVTALFTTIAFVSITWGPRDNIRVLIDILFLWLGYLLLRRNIFLYQKQEEMRDQLLKEEMKE